MQHKPENCVARSSQSQSNSEFAGAARDRVRHYPVKTKACESERQSAEDRGQSRDELLLPQGAADLVREGSNVSDGKIRIDARKRLPDLFGERCGIASGANVGTLPVTRSSKRISITRSKRSRAACRSRICIRS